MKRVCKSMNAILGIVLGVALLGAISASPARAQCIDMSKVKRGATLKNQSWTGRAGSPSLLLVSLGGNQAQLSAGQEPIVGFWKVTFKAPDNSVVDSAFVQWHSDGTEIMNSSRPPITQSYCLGVWRKTGPNQYMLNHFAISWDSAENLVGPANIQEHITLSHDHNSFSGTFSIAQYDTNGTELGGVSGTIEGHRITINTTIGDVL